MSTGDQDGDGHRGGYENIPENVSSVSIDLEGASSSSSEDGGEAAAPLCRGPYDSLSDAAAGASTPLGERVESDDDDGDGEAPSYQRSDGPRRSRRGRRRRSARAIPPLSAEEGNDRSSRSDTHPPRRGGGGRFVPALLLGAAAAATLYRSRRDGGRGGPAVAFLNLDVLGEVRSASSSTADGTKVPLEGFSFSQILPGGNNGFGGPQYTLAGGDGWSERGGSSYGASAGGTGTGSSRTFKCEYAGLDQGRSITMLQTSRRDPDKQWVDTPCVRNDDAVFAQDDAMDSAAVLWVELPTAEPRRHQRFQSVIGFGGAITEATSLNWKRLSGAGQNLVLELLYGKSGLGYTLGRVPIGSCDFSVTEYDFHSTDGDFDLAAFDTHVRHDVDNGMIELMNRAASWVRNNWHMGAELRLVASPWSPPAWMKRPVPGVDPRGASHAEGTDMTARPECLRDGAGPDSRYARAWARYMASFLDAYAARGINVWAVTAQNAPTTPPSGSPAYEACAHTVGSERDFVAHHLGPVLREDHPGVKILLYDDDKGGGAEWMSQMWNEEDASAKKAGSKASSTTAADVSQYVDGVALHWYSRAADRRLDGGEGTPNMHLLKQLASDHERRQQQTQKTSPATAPDAAPPEPPILLDTEASHCSSTGYALNDQEVSWRRAERYAHAILSQLAAGSNGWIDWNMVLDPFGGPNHVENFCDAPIIAVPHRAVNAFDIQPIPSFEKHQLEEGEAVLGEYETKYSLNKKMGYPMAYMDAGIVVQPVFFYIGHVTRHVRPGSRPVRALVDQSRGGTVARTFRRRGQTEPGGGRNVNARVGTEVTLWPCEGSTRQAWFFAGSGQLRVRQASSAGGGGGGDEHNGNGNGNGNDNGGSGGQEGGCVALADVADRSLGGLLLTGCDSKNAAVFELAPTGASYESMQVVKFVVQHKVNKCLGILPLANDGGAYGRRGGAQAAMVSCDHPSSLWEYFPQTGEVLSYFFSPPNENGTVCLTTGWPFLQAGAFDTTPSAADGSAVVVVLNESDDEANFVVTLSNGADPPPVLKSSIPAHSIQTYSL